MKFTNSLISSTQKAYQNWREPEYAKTLAGTYWRIALGITTCIVALVIVYGILHLLEIEKGAKTGPRAVVAAQSLDRKRLTQTLLGFEVKEMQFEALKTNALTVLSDPSR